MIQKLEITKVWRDSNPTQYGSFKTNLKFKQHGDKWISGFAKDFNHKEGDVVELDIVENEKGTKDKDGNVYINWKFPNKEKVLEDRVTNLEKQVREIVAYLNKKLNDGLTSAGTPVPTFVPNTPEQAEDFAKKMDDYEKVNGDLNAIAEEEFNKI